LITDAFEGVETFFEPEEEILVSPSGEEVAQQLRALTPARAREIGNRALRRVLGEHTYDHRAALLEQTLEGGGGAGSAGSTGGAGIAGEGIAAAGAIA
jgi:spore maturation protein CgeB